jgi:hypothetical protein
VATGSLDEPETDSEQMIYAIRAVGTPYIKFGKAKSVGKRLAQLETGCPFDLHIEAVADWPDGQESAIHQYLGDDCQKFEWFRDSDKTASVLAWMCAPEGLGGFQQAFTEFASARGLTRFSGAVSALRKAKIAALPKEPRKWARVKKRPCLDAVYDDTGLNSRLEQIKQRVMARLRKAA